MKLATGRESMPSSFTDSHKGDVTYCAPFLQIVPHVAIVCLPVAFVAISGNMLNLLS